MLRAIHFIPVHISTIEVSLIHYEISAQIAEALEAAHEKRVIRPYLKPANIKINPKD